jgi:hypothetical protein
LLGPDDSSFRNLCRTQQTLPAQSEGERPNSLAVNSQSQHSLNQIFMSYHEDTAIRTQRRTKKKRSAFSPSGSEKGHQQWRFATQGQ